MSKDREPELLTEEPREEQEGPKKENGKKRRKKPRQRETDLSSQIERAIKTLFGLIEVDEKEYDQEAKNLEDWLQDEGIKDNLNQVLAGVLADLWAQANIRKDSGEELDPRQEEILEFVAAAAELDLALTEEEVKKRKWQRKRREAAKKLAQLTLKEGKEETIKKLTDRIVEVSRSDRGEPSLRAIIDERVSFLQETRKAVDGLIEAVGAVDRDREEIEELLEQIERAPRGVRDIQQTLLGLLTEQVVDEEKVEETKQELEKLVAKSEKAGIDLDSVLRIAEMVYGISRIAKRIGEEETAGARAIREFIVWLRNQKALKKQQEEELRKKREEMRKAREEMRAAAQRTAEQFDLTEEYQEMIEEIASFREVYWLIRELEEKLITTEDKKEKKEIRKALEVARAIKRAFIRSARARVKDNPLWQARQVELESDLASFRQTAELVLKKIQAGGLNYDQAFWQLKALKEKYQQKYRDLEAELGLPEFLEGALLDQFYQELGEIWAPIIEAFEATIVVTDDPWEQQRQFRRLFEAVMVLGEDPDLLFYSGANQMVLRFLQRENIIPEIRAEYRARMALYRLLAHRQSADFNLQLLAKFFPNLARIEHLNTIRDVPELKLALKILDESAQEEDLQRNIFFARTLEDGRSALDYCASRLRKEIFSYAKAKLEEAKKRRNQEEIAYWQEMVQFWSLKNKSDSEKEIILTKAKSYLREVSLLDQVLVGPGRPGIAKSRALWVLLRLSCYNERCEQAGIGRPPLIEAMFGLSPVEFFDEASGQWRRAPATRTEKGEQPRNSVSWGLRTPAEFILSQLSLDQLRNLGFKIDSDLSKRKLLETRLLGKERYEVVMQHGDQQFRGCWVFVKERKGKPPMEIWVTTETDEKGEEKVVQVINVVNGDLATLLEAAPYCKQDILDSYFHTVSKIDKLREAFEQRDGLAFPPEALDIKEMTEEIYAMVRDFAAIYNSALHLPSLEKELRARKKELEDKIRELRLRQEKEGLSAEEQEKLNSLEEKRRSLTEEDIRKPGVLYQEDWAYNWTESLVKYYLGRLDPDLHKLFPRLSWSPNIFASQVLRAAAGAGLITLEQEKRLEQEIWGRDINFGLFSLRRRALAERMDALLINWRGPYKAMMLLGWLFFFLSQLFRVAKEEAEK